MPLAKKGELLDKRKGVLLRTSVLLKCNKVILPELTPVFFTSAKHEWKKGVNEGRITLFYESNTVCGKKYFFLLYNILFFSIRHFSNKLKATLNFKNDDLKVNWPIRSNVYKKRWLKSKKQWLKSKLANQEQCWQKTMIKK